MKVIKPSFRIEERDEKHGGLSIIERAGRLCYKSEDKITDTSAKDFVCRIINSGHHSVLEHGDMIFEISDYHIYQNVAEGLQMIRDRGDQPPMLEMTRIGIWPNERYIVSGNIRAWRELFASGSGAGAYFIGYFDSVFVEGYGFFDEGMAPDPRVKQIFYKDLVHRGEKLAHMRQSVRFIVDRGVSHEFVRHRTMSFSQESTRYCNYSLDKFGRGITVIDPCYLDADSLLRRIWHRGSMSGEAQYIAMLNHGMTPQEARGILPHSTKTELIMTGNLRSWKHFFDLRALGKAGAPHPQVKEVVYPLYEIDQLAYPDIFN